jgi:hypothetical protein
MVLTKGNITTTLILFFIQYLFHFKDLLPHEETKNENILFSSPENPRFLYFL